MVTKANNEVLYSIVVSGIYHLFISKGNVLEQKTKIQLKSEDSKVQRASPQKVLHELELWQNPNDQIKIKCPRQMYY